MVVEGGDMVGMTFTVLLDVRTKSLMKQFWILKLQDPLSVFDPPLIHHRHEPHFYKQH